MRCSLPRTIIAGSSLLAALLLSSVTQAASIQAGAAKIDITPETPIRLSGYGNRRAESDGVSQRLFASALAVREGDDGRLSILITVDNTGVPEWMTEGVYKELATDLKLDRAQFALTSTHTHTAPMLTGMLPNLFSMDIPPDQQARIDAYSQELARKLVQVGVEAVKKLSPAELWWGQGRAQFGKNRRTQNGPVDHDVSMLAVRGLDGDLRAVWLNYACHCTTLGGDFNQHNGDWAGYARDYIEAKQPGALALVSIGCGADINPHPRTGVQLAQQHGQELADEVNRVLTTDLTQIKDAPRGALERITLAFDTIPTRTEWEARAKQDGIIGYHARVNLERLDRGEKIATELPYTVQTWAFGTNLAVVFLPGEVVVDFALRLKREYQRVWVNGYANDVPCYIPSERIWLEGGYEGGGAMPYYDRPTRLQRDTEERIFAALHRLIPDEFKVDAEFPSPKSPAESLRSIRVVDGLKVELVAAEPLVIDPVAIDFGSDGKLWIAEMHDYPQGLDGNFTPGGRLKFLEDTNGDGHFDKAVVLADDLPFPTGVLAWNQGALVCAAPDILYLEDKDQDGKAEVRRKLYSGFATHNYQARVNSLRWGLDGWVYAAAGLFGGEIISHATGEKLALSGRDFRIQPDTGAVEPVAGLSQQGRVRDDFGNWFGCDNSALMWHFPYPEKYLARNPALSVSETRVYVPSWPNPNQLFPISRTLERFNDPNNVNRVTSACGLEVYRDTALGEAFYHNGFTAEPVHNLVRRIVVEPSGGTFKGRLAPGEERVEFLASTDNWFRPVEVRTGPDGALWIVDMYRFVIEHPIWISAERLAQLDVRAGDRHGRIYRVLHSNEDSSKPAWDNLQSKSTADLVSILAGGNGTLRDLAHRALLERNDASAVPLLRQIVGSDNPPGARAQALYLLDQVRALDEAIVLEALNSSVPGLRIVGLRLSERHLDRWPSVKKKLLQMNEDPAAEVRYQLAFSLGQITDEKAGIALGKLAVTGDFRTRTAVLSSARMLAPVILKEILRHPSRNGLEQTIRQLIGTTAKLGDPAAKTAMLELVVPGEDESIQSWHFETLGSLLDGTPHSLKPEIKARLARVTMEARRVAGNESATIKDRRSAIEFIGASAMTDSDLKLLAGFFKAGQPEDLRVAALNSLKQSRSPKVAEILLNNWSSSSVASRSSVIDALLSRDEWAIQVLQAVESGAISARQISAANRQLLTRHSNPEVLSRAERIFGSRTLRNRQHIIEKYSTVAEMNGDAIRGLRVFHDQCASCHQFRGLGHPLGPDLATYHDKPISEYLEAILDPNAVIEPRFVTYQIETKDDRSLSGVVENETVNSLTVTMAGGLKETVLRSDILSMRASDLSLMPEGLDAGLDMQAMTDLIAYLKSGVPASFGSAASSAAEAARKSFSAKANNRLRIISASEYLEYPSWLGRLPFYHCRQTDGKGRVEWEMAPVAEHGAADDWVRFTMPAGMGLYSQPAGHFKLFMNGHEVFQFNVTLGDAAWESPSLPVRATFTVKESNQEDANGVLTLEVKRDALPEKEPVRWAVTGSPSSSMRWFGIYLLEQADASHNPSLATSSDSDTEEIAASILNDALSQPEREALIRDHAEISAELIREMAEGLENKQEEYRRIPWIWRVAIAAGKRNDAPELKRLLEVSLPRKGEKLRDWQAVVIGGGLINGVSLAGAWPGARLGSILNDSQTLRNAWETALNSAKAMAHDDSVPAGTRYDALRIIALLPWNVAKPFLVEHLRKGAHPELQQGSVSGLVDVPEAEAGALLVRSLPILTDHNRALALEGLARSRQRIAQVRQAVEDGVIEASIIPSDRRAQFGMQ